MKKLLCAFFLMSVWCLNAKAIEEINNQKIYYLKDCIKFATENSPVIKKAKNNLNAAKDNLGITKSKFFPVLGAGAGFYQYVNSTNNYDDGYWKRNFPSVSVYLEQLLFDFGKTNADINMAKFYVTAAEYEYNDSICETIVAVKTAYFNALEAMYTVDVFEKNLLINEKIVEKMKQLYESGKKSKTDYINSKVYLIDAKMKREDAINNYNAAIADLCNAMYIDDVEDIKIKNINEFHYKDAYFNPSFLEKNLPEIKNGVYIPNTENHHTNKEFEGDITPLPFTLQEAYDSAKINNPELKVLENTVEAMKQQLLYVKRGIAPELKAKAGYDRDGKYVSQTDSIKNNRLNIAVTFESAVNIKRQKHGIDSAKGMLDTAIIDIELFKKNIHYEIKKAYADVITAQKQIYNARDKVKSSIENLECVTNDYKSGNTASVGFLEVQNAMHNYNLAKLEYIEKLKVYNNSLARLEKATHYHGEGMHEYKDMHSLCNDPEHNHNEKKTNRNK